MTTWPTLLRRRHAIHQMRGIALRLAADGCASGSDATEVVAAQRREVEVPARRMADGEPAEV